MTTAAAVQPSGQSVESAGDLARKAERCRRLAAGISDRQAAEVLRAMAVQYENGGSDLKR